MDAGRIKANLESALRDALFSSRPAPAKPGAGTAEGHDTAHPGRSGVVVNLTSSVREAQRQVAEVRANLPHALVDRAASTARETAVLGKALQSAHTGRPAALAEALARAQERAPAGETQRPRIGGSTPLDAAPALARDARGLPLPLPGGTDAPAARPAPELGRAMQTAHTEAAAAAVAKALVRPEMRAALESTPGLRIAAEMLIDPAPPRGQPSPTAPTQAAPQAVPMTPGQADAAARMETHAPQVALMAMGGPAAGAASHAEAAKAAQSAGHRTHPELVAPFLVRQEPTKDSPSYLNQIIIGTAFLGLVVLLLM